MGVQRVGVQVQVRRMTTKLYGYIFSESTKGDTSAMSATQTYRAHCLRVFENQSGWKGTRTRRVEYASMTKHISLVFHGGFQSFGIGEYIPEEDSVLPLCGGAMDGI